MSKDKGGKNVKKAPADKALKGESNYKAESKKTSFEQTPLKPTVGKAKKP